MAVTTDRNIDLNTNLTQFLTDGKMDEVVDTLDGLKDLETLKHLQAPLSNAFGREITPVDMRVLRFLLKQYVIHGFPRDFEGPKLDEKRCLKVVLKLVWALHKDGAWNYKVMGLDHSGKESERWLVQGFLTADDVYDQLKANQWVGGFSDRHPGALSLYRISTLSKDKQVADTVVDVDADGVRMCVAANLTLRADTLIEGINKASWTDKAPKIDDPKVAALLEEKIKGCYWKYNLTSVTRK